jgi:A/G-specific adenine glycosylase
MIIDEISLKREIRSRKKKFTDGILEWSVRNFSDYPWRKTSNTYEILISELLLRRTRASNVVEVYEKFIRKFPTIFDLSKSSLKDIENLIKPLGIKSRSHKIKLVSEDIVKNYSGHIPTKEKELLSVIGNKSFYTANAVFCFGLNRKVPIFDVNVKRIFERVFSINFGKSPHKKKQSFELVAVALPDRNIQRYNWALLDLGKAVCTSSNPKCPECPLKSICDYALKRVGYVESI